MDSAVRLPLQGSSLGRPRWRIVSDVVSELLHRTRTFSWELVNNNFPVSFCLWNRAVVPLGEVFVEDDGDVGFEVLGVFTADGVGFGEDFNGRALHELVYGLNWTRMSRKTRR